MFGLLEDSIADSKLIDPALLSQGSEPADFANWFKMTGQLLTNSVLCLPFSWLTMLLTPYYYILLELKLTK